MIKADTSSLSNLIAQLNKQLDQFCLRYNDIFRLQTKLESNWDAEKCGSFSAAMDKIKGAKLDVESGIIEIRNLIVEMIELAEQYNRIKF